VDYKISKENSESIEIFDSFKVNYKLIIELIYETWVINFEEEI